MLYDLNEHSFTEKEAASMLNSTKQIRDSLGWPTTKRKFSVIEITKGLENKSIGHGCVFMLKSSQSYEELMDIL